MIAGEAERWRSRPAVQPGGRRPAPWPLGFVQAFVNTHYDLEGVHGAEVLHSPDAVASWFASWDVAATPPPLSPADVHRVLALREGLRSLARANSAGGLDPGVLDGLNAAAEGAGVELRFVPAGPQFVPIPGTGLDGAVGLLLAITATAILAGSWRRLKICPAEDCGWAFYDHSRNQTGRWCSMSVCGARAKARAHYRRRRST